MESRLAFNMTRSLLMMEKNDGNSMCYVVVPDRC